MNKKQKIVRLLGTLLIAGLMAGAVSSTVVSALGLGSRAFGAYAGALMLALVSALCAYSALTAVIGVAGGTVALGAWLATGLSEGGAARALFDALKAANQEGAAALAGSAGLLAGALAGVLAVIFFVLLTERGAISTMFAVSVTLGATVVCAALSERVRLVQLTPAIVGACAAIAHSAEQRRTGGHLKALIPAVLAVLLALALVPGSGFTVKPLEDAATKVKQLYEDYFNYTQERVAFTISERGFDYYGLRDDTPTHMLGGPANPTADAVMLVTTDSDLLLRGTVRGTYTGYSWEDTTAKARTLYYDFTRLSRRDSVFGTSLLEDLENLDSAFTSVTAEVRMLADGSSTLFVPGRLTDFDMTLRNAVYYNTVGEIFLARSVEKGDEYAFTAAEVTDYSALPALAAGAGEDDGYEAAARQYTQLPEGIEQGVYQIADALTEGKGTPAEKAQAILEGLKANCTYKTDVGYPPQDRDFVSYFLIDSREGYCSYFATAMAVLCRIEGIPARYVEGYRVYADDGATTVTGESAHAWVEVYLSGIGWVAYDPTPGRNDAPENGNTTEPDVTPEPTPTAQPSPEPTDDASADVENPTPNPEDQPTADPTSDPTLAPTENPHDLPEQKQSSGRWLWILLIALLVLIVAALLYLWIKSRLEKTDPVRLASKQSDPDKAILILYRALLTLLSQLGQSPLSGETPEAFALRVCRGGMANPDFEAFAKGVTVARYSRARATRELASLGSRAYVRFRQQMKKSERVKFDAYRVLHGLGDFTAIP